ncbi:hypothetical protein K2Q02_00115 [Patescibacteria group bacterium]|nr:hypothetical protein [Patescibacteria group bacterium]
MDPTIPTSFIPKRPITSESMQGSSYSTRSSSVGLLTLITVVVVIATAVSFGGVYLYEKRLSSQKTTLEDSINTARDGIGSEFVSDMQRLNARISGVQELLNSHIVVSPIFTELQNTTLRSIQYSQFKYDIGTDTVTKASIVKVDLGGTARSYSTIALQSDAFSDSKIIKNPVFSNLNVDDKTGRVEFKLAFTVAIDDLSYQKFFESINKAQAATEQSTSIIPQ